MRSQKTAILLIQEKLQNTFETVVAEVVSKAGICYIMIVHLKRHIVFFYPQMLSSTRLKRLH